VIEGFQILSVLLHLILFPLLFPTFPFQDFCSFYKIFVKEWDVKKSWFMYA
jgi:hypothetical protein